MQEGVTQVERRRLRYFLFAAAAVPPAHKTGCGTLWGVAAASRSQCPSSACHGQPSPQPELGLAKTC